MWSWCLVPLGNLSSQSFIPHVSFGYLPDILSTISISLVKCFAPRKSTESVSALSSLILLDGMQISVCLLVFTFKVFIASTQITFLPGGAFGSKCNFRAIFVSVLV